MAAPAQAQLDLGSLGPPLPPTDERYALSGTVERVTYRNPETGFAVLKVKAKGHPKPIAVVGRTGCIEPGERLEAEGWWVNDPKYGLQFQADKVATALPATCEGMERYLGSGMVDGIGPIHASRLVKAFGEDTFRIIEAEPWRLRGVPGIGPVRAASLLNAWSDQRAMRELALFLHEHGLPPERAEKVHRQFGAGALAMVKSDPYRLTREMRGFGFNGADKLAHALGVPSDDPARLRAGVLHVLERAAEEGCCGLPLAEARALACSVLDLPPERIEKAIDAEVAAGNLVIEDVGDTLCLFAGWSWRGEALLARRLREIASAPLPWRPLQAEEAAESYRQRTGRALEASQVAALGRLLASKAAVLTGGPGVGKTTLMDALVRGLARNGVKVALAAPTGRAARRLSEVTGIQAVTIHRLLEIDVAAGRFRRGPDRPLDCDLLVVDEASMLDLRLAQALLVALPRRAALLLVGDVDQLPAIGPGDVLRDVIASGVVPVVRLTEVFRQAAGSRIVASAHRINRGQAPEPPPAGSETDFYLVEARDAATCRDRVLQLVAERIPLRFGLDARRDVQVLCPMHKGRLGAQALSLDLQQALNPPTGLRLHRGPLTFGVGDRVMQVENDHERDVYNGEIGFVTVVDMEANGIAVEFDGRTLTYQGMEMDRLTLAYAITVHKAQGSEFPAVVIPLSAEHGPMLRRNLLYTAVTRGRKLVVLVGDRAALARAVAEPGLRPRWSTLAQRLREAADELAGRVSRQAAE